MSFLKLLAKGMAATVEAAPRRGLRRFGVPLGGPMDDHAACWANRLVGNDEVAPLLELLWGGARIEITAETNVAVTGAPVKTSLPLWRALPVKRGQIIEIAPGTSGVWVYVAAGPLNFGSTPWKDIRDYNSPPTLRVWNGPQREMFSDAFFDQEWTVTTQCNRVGYRLTGEPLEFTAREILSEPVRVGTIQIPDSGLPIVTMRDGPTVGGYPKLGMVDPEDVSWLAQCRPGQKVRFLPLNQ